MIFRKSLSVALAAVMIAATFLFTGCAEKKTDENRVYNIGICQLVTHEALDAATAGFKQALIDELGEDHVKFDEQNAAGSSDTCVTIVNSFVASKVDLILANATAALQAAANATVDIPILGTSITEYGVALDIDGFNGTVGGNISGTSDLAPLNEQADMITEVIPNAKTVGIIYCSAEPNSAYQVSVVRSALEAKGLTVEEYKFADSNDVALIAENAAAACDAIYIPTDNTAASCAKTIDNAVRPKKVPIIAGEAGICSGCGVATLSISYSELGYTTGKMAARILKGEAKISEMPIEYDTKPVKKYNAEICADLGITPPEGYEPLGG